MTHVDLQTILTTWKGDGGTIVLYAVLITLAVAYGLAARRRSPRGRRWPRARTACFVAGLALFGLIYGSGLEVYEDQPTVHVIQHMLTMMAAPPLLVLGAPITLLLRTVAPRRRPAIVRLLDDPSFAMLSGPRAPMMLTLDYFLTMFIYQLTPLRTWSEQSTELHFIVHQYFLLCGLFFWWPVVAADPVRLRLSALRQARHGVARPAGLRAARRDRARRRLDRDGRRLPGQRWRPDARGRRRRRRPGAWQRCAHPRGRGPSTSAERGLGGRGPGERGGRAGLTAVTTIVRSTEERRAWAWAVLGLAGSVLVAGCAPRALHDGAVGWWYAPGWPGRAATTLIYVGMAALAVAWVGLGRDLPGRRTLLAIAALWILPAGAGAAPVQP